MLVSEKASLLSNKIWHSLFMSTYIKILKTLLLRFSENAKFITIINNITSTVQNMFKSI